MEYKKEDNLKELTPSKIEELLPGFLSVFEECLELVHPYTKGLPLHKDTPSTVFCKKELLDRLVGNATSQSVHPDNDKRGYAHFSYTDRSIYVEIEAFARLIQEENIDQMRDILIEEILHFQTSSYVVTNKYSGFMQIDNTIETRKYSGRFYELVEEDSSPGNSYREDLDELVATENLVRFLTEMINHPKKIIFIANAANLDEIKEDEQFVTYPNQLISFFNRELKIDLIKTLLSCLQSGSLENFKKFIAKNKKDLPKDPQILRFLKLLEEIDSKNFIVITLDPNLLEK